MHSSHVLGTRFRLLMVCGALGGIFVQTLRAEMLYVSNGGDGSVKVITMTGAVSTYATGFSTPRGLAFDDADNLYVACNGDKTVRKVAPNGQVSTFASGLSGDLYGVAVLAGDIYVASLDSMNVNSAILRIAPNGSVSTFASVEFPGGLVFDNSGNLYATRSVGGGPAGAIGGINKVDGVGSVTALVASGLVNPIGLARDASGFLYAAEFAGDQRVYRAASDGSVAVFASGVGRPYGLVIGVDGYLYSADFTGGTIYKTDPTGNAALFATGLSSPRFMVCGPDVPEPASLALVALGGLALIRRRRTA